MTCREAQKGLTDGFSRVGSNGRWQELEEHVSDCPQCAARLQATEPIRRLLRQCCRRVTAPTALRMRIAGALPHRAA